MGIFKKLGWFFKAEKKRYTWGLIFLLMADLAGLVPPRVIGILADKMGAKQLTLPLLFSWLGFLLLAAVVQYLSRFGWRNMIWGGAATLERELRTQLFSHFLKMDATFFQRHRTGDLMAHATNDLNAVQNVAGAGILTFADSILTGGTTIVAMLIFVDWRLTLVALLPMPLLAVMARVLGKHLHSAFSESQAAFSRLNDKTQESVSGVKVIKTFGQEDEDVADFEQIVDKTITINKKVYRIDSLFDPITTLIIGLTYAITIAYGGHLVVTQAITLGQLISFVAYIGALVWPMFAIGRLFNVIERGNASYDRVQELLNETSEAVTPKVAGTHSLHGDLDYQVSEFKYPDDPRVALKQIHFELKQGQTLGLVGRVGAGKTTIIKLLLREFDHYQGKITIGGHDIRDYNLDSVLASIGYVPQENFLFSTNIRDNIRFAAMTKPQEEVEQAAKESAIHEDILNFSQQYDTLVGEKGVSLSGGQKQRLSIARAIMTLPEILILDDALSAVDAKTEAEILTDLKEDRDQKTTIIAAHRLSSVANADEILVIDDGQIVERGNHEELLANDGWYAEMWRKQQIESQLGGESNDAETNE
ncbi:ABC transporter ATP-binding protein [Lapidilactobacillus wuchangensis]|uniref:ABC transporter ATP-binding protein n=1 Tax=Lapidilactobacillus wuchangensis TaxID=2486001 RepID=UPI000F7A3406|nr:ABC transporter transmembrane domain-containing protein [Lapidilactobacillus wuchangensis]